MSHVLLGQFSPRHSTRSTRPPPESARPLLSQVVNDLQVIAGESPIRLGFVAVFVRALAMPLRRHIAQEAARNDQPFE